MKIRNRKAALMIAAMLLAAPGLAFAADPLKGMITAHDGSTITVRGGGGDTTVTLTESTKIRGVTGVLGVRGDDHPASDLIRGLAVEVVTAEDGTASEITFKKSDLKTAQQISAGIAGTEERIDNVGELMAAGRIKVFFASGSTAITPEGKQELKKIASQAEGIKGSRLVIVGRADPTGNAAANQRLSAQRAAAVKSYLIKTEGVSPARILPTAAVGDSPVAQDPDPPANDDEARRVTVTIAVSKSARPQ